MFNPTLIPDIHSTQEIQTNKVWIDGKPIYRKIFYIDSLPNNTTKNYSASITNLDLITEYNGIVKHLSSNKISYYPFNIPGITSYYEETNIVVNTTSNRTSDSGYIIIEYTKTTD